jgi:hypothetical protein
MVIDLDPPAYLAQFAGSRASAPAKPIHRTRVQPSYAMLSRAEHEAKFEREHGSYWTPGLLDRLTLPLTRYHE